MDGDTYFFTLFAVFSFALGSSIASFLNVCIWRIPRGESVSRPASHCPKCGAPIRWWQNLPVLSWLMLRGRCFSCHERISPRYILIELLGGALFLLTYLQWAMPFFFDLEPVFGMSPIYNPYLMGVNMVAYAGLILGSFVDIDHYWIPDRVTIGGMALGVPLNLAAWVAFLGGWAGPGTWKIAEYHVWGLLLGFLGLWAVGFIFSKIFRKEAMGFGDVKLLGAIGAFFGPIAVVFTLVMSSFLGSAVGLSMIALGKTKMGKFTAIPYGPFLALGAAAWMLWGENFVVLYLKWVLQ